MAALEASVQDAKGKRSRSKGSTKKSKKRVMARAPYEPDAAMLDGRFTGATTAPGRCVSADLVLEVELAVDVGVRHIAQPHVVVPGVTAKCLPCNSHVDVRALGVHPLGLLDHDA